MPIDLSLHEKIVLRTSLLSIGVNLLLATIKIIVGILSSSVAILSEDINNVADVSIGILTMLGIKLANKPPNKEHPFGYGRIEYFTSFIIAALILIAGGELLIYSIKLILGVDELYLDGFCICIIAFSLVLKLLLGMYAIKMGKKVESSSLTALGLDALNDSYASLITIVSSLIFLIFEISIDAYAGILISLFVLRTGYIVIKESLSDLLGRKGKKELAQQIYRDIMQTEAVLGAANMMFHNYGPCSCTGSVNLEFSHTMTMAEINDLVHRLQLKIMEKYNVSMVFGIYAIDSNSSLGAAIGEFVQSQVLVKSFHGVYLDSKTKTIYCDFTVDCSLEDWESLHGKTLFRLYYRALYRA